MKFNKVILSAKVMSNLPASAQFGRVRTGLAAIQSSAFFKRPIPDPPGLDISYCFVISLLKKILTANTGVIVGLLGFTFMTEISGVSWLNVSPDTNITLYSARHGDPNTGFAESYQDVTCNTYIIDKDD